MAARSGCNAAATTVFGDVGNSRLSARLHLREIDRLSIPVLQKNETSVLAGEHARRARELPDALAFVMQMTMSTAVRRM
jgi:hypothetical protein